jgi:hypothetical protein
MRNIHGVGLAVAAADLLAADYAVAAPISKAESARAWIAAEGAATPMGHLPRFPPGPKMARLRYRGAQA